MLLHLASGLFHQAARLFFVENHRYQITLFVPLSYILQGRLPAHQLAPVA
jgi:hypothetical protein